MRRKEEREKDSQDPGATVNGRTESRQEKVKKFKTDNRMAEGGDRMQLRSMVDKDK